MEVATYHRHRHQRGLEAFFHHVAGVFVFAKLQDLRWKVLGPNNSKKTDENCWISLSESGLELKLTKTMEFRGNILGNNKNAIYFRLWGAHAPSHQRILGERTVGTFGCFG